MTDDMRKRLNESYKPLVEKAERFLSGLLKLHNGFNATVGFYSGYCHKYENGDYHQEDYPIPVISVKGLCDIDIDFDMITVTARLTKNQIITLDWSIFQNTTFKVYGRKGLKYAYGDEQNVELMKNNVMLSDEDKFCIAYYFLPSVNVEKIFKFLHILAKNQFFY